MSMTRRKKAKPMTKEELMAMKEGEIFFALSYFNTDIIRPVLFSQANVKIDKTAPGADLTYDVGGGMCYGVSHLLKLTPETIDKWYQGRSDAILSEMERVINLKKEMIDQLGKKQ
jgi:hypothetical protein